MPKVTVLPPEIVSKIAAGEVIERPASVVKELLENALDANADSIELHLKDAGKTLIHFKDNGDGIAQDDLKKIFLRHATSKIKTSDDLFAINSLGFRGEALYSVAAIADIVLKSRIKEQDSGWEIHLRGSKELNLHPHTMGETGTEIQVQELFYNTPARKKFLKSNTTELNQILNIVVPYTLLHHKKRFVVTHQGKTILDLNPAEEMSTRAAETLNLNEKHIINAAPFTSKEENISIQMILGDINIKRAKRDTQFIFINNRPVQNKSISFHFNQIYKLIMPQSSFPFFAVFINIPYEDIDVNIHPTKREVKIKDEQRLCSMLRSICEETLMTCSNLKQADDIFTFENNSGSSPSTAAQSTSNPNTVKESQYEFPTQRSFTPDSNEETPSYSYPKTKSYKPSSDNFSGHNTTSPTRSQEFFIPEDNFIKQTQNSLYKKLEAARYVGVFINKYQIFEADKSLLLIDQHAAQERITYEQLIQQMEKGKVECQHLLSPVLVKLSVQDMLIWEEAKEKFNEIGFSSNQWDNETIAIQSYPNLIKDIEKAVRHLLAGENISKADHDSIARRACRSSVMAGDKLTQQQAEFQRTQLMSCLDPFTCPHGRPIVVEMTEEFVDKQFLR